MKLPQFHGERAMAEFDQMYQERRQGWLGFCKLMAAVVVGAAVILLGMLLFLV
jgi:hypothetical protein